MYILISLFASSNEDTIAPTHAHPHTVSHPRIFSHPANHFMIGWEYYKTQIMLFMVPLHMYHWVCVYIFWNILLEIKKGIYSGIYLRKKGRKNRFLWVPSQVNDKTSRCNWMLPIDLQFIIEKRKKKKRRCLSLSLSRLVSASTSSYRSNRNQSNPVGVGHNITFMQILLLKLFWNCF